MTPERWRQVRSLLEAALERSADERQAFLDAACPDPETRREVSSLLAVEHDAADFIETPAFDLHGTTDGADGDGASPPADPGLLDRVLAALGLRATPTQPVPKEKGRPAKADRP